MKPIIKEQIKVLIEIEDRINEGKAIWPFPSDNTGCLLCKVATYDGDIICVNSDCIVPIMNNGSPCFVGDMSRYLNTMENLLQIADGGEDRAINEYRIKVMDFYQEYKPKFMKLLNEYGWREYYETIKTETTIIRNKE